MIGDLGTIIIDDTIAPEIYCQATIDVQCLSEVPLPDVTQVTATDNCTTTPVVEFVRDVASGESCPLIIAREYRAIDDCGNESGNTHYLLIK